VLRKRPIKQVWVLSPQDEEASVQAYITGGGSRHAFLSTLRGLGVQFMFIIHNHCAIVSECQGGLLISKIAAVLPIDSRQVLVKSLGVTVFKLNFFIFLEVLPGVCKVAI
jgi:hypothetical protein